MRWRFDQRGMQGSTVPSFPRSGGRKLTDDGFPTMKSRLDRAVRSLGGVAVGDAVGRAVSNVGRMPPEYYPAPWPYTDDTEMAIELVEALSASGRVHQDALAVGFAKRFALRPGRGYGAVAHWILTRIGEGQPWRKIAYTPYGGSGSKGNGAAMRVAPLGAFFSDDPDQMVREAMLSAEVTHAHPQGQAGAVAVALAAAAAVNHPDALLPRLGELAASVSDSELRAALERAASLGGVTPREAGRILGTGRDVLALDTVPFALWCAFSHLRDFGAALSAAIEGFDAPDSDADTVCAIVGGIVVLACDPGSIPDLWLQSSEKPTRG